MKCKCTKCGHESHGAVVEKRHRRCGGRKGAPLRDKADKLPSADRGVWQQAG